MRRWSQVALLAGLAIFYSLVVFNNLTDFDSNFQFVRHVLSMDSTFPGNHGMWRAMTGRGWHLAFYLSIIVWEAVTALLLWLGVFQLVRSISLNRAAYRRAMRIPLLALTLSLLMWLVAFLSVGAEWFLMWQSHIWNGQEAAFRMFVVAGIVYLSFLLPEPESREEE